MLIIGFVAFILLNNLLWLIDVRDMLDRFELRIRILMALMTPEQLDELEERLKDL